MGEIRILQLGNENWNDRYTVPKGVSLEYTEIFKEPSEKLYDMVFLDRELKEEEIIPLHKSSKAYTVFVTEHVKAAGKAAWFLECKKAKRIAEDEIQTFLSEETRFFYSKPYGEKYEFKNLGIAQGFAGNVKWYGNYCVDLEGTFGEEMCQIVFWRNNIPLFLGQVIDLWLEYRKSPDISIALEVTLFAQGSLSEVLKRWRFEEEELDQVVQIENSYRSGSVFMSIHAKGKGKLRVIALHDRYSRGKHGYFMPGGERYVTSKREEVFCYFDPGDKKPPLNVYFSGYKTAQGFEGYYLMRSKGCPFLLVSEPRLEGGCCYMGSKEYEGMLLSALRRYMKELGFTSDQVILSGISGGTFGALYYGCDIRPHALILGKPVASMGNVAANEKHLRPGGLPASLDMLLYLCSGTNQKAIDGLNRKFWDKFDTVDWGKSKFIISYMIEDDYDPNGYQDLLSHLSSGGVQVYGKGIHGRHNDNTPAIVSWFSSQYDQVLYEDFGRRTEKK